MAKKKESGLRTACLRWIVAKGGDAYAVHGSALQRTGEPDICGELPDGKGGWIHLKIECKMDTGVVAPIQQYRIDRYAQLGYCAGVVYSVQDLIELVECYENNLRSTGR